MDADTAAALRKPFDPKQIGKLPKGGVTLDFVGHAATTDRLLQVDPAWTWEPLALTPEGLPALDRAGNLWIKLTIAGVTRLGVGDGKTAKECIGDAIRNAAMRFGVALDLWAKEDLSHDESRPSSLPSSGAPVGNGGEGAAAGAGTSAAAAADPKSQFVFDPGKGEKRTEAQAKLIRTNFDFLVAKDVFSEEALINAAKTLGAVGETVDEIVEGISHPAARELINKLLNLKKNVGRQAA